MVSGIPTMRHLGHTFTLEAQFGIRLAVQYSCWVLLESSTRTGHWNTNCCQEIARLEDKLQSWCHVPAIDCKTY
jgi:hypothetical protein